MKSSRGLGLGIVLALGALVAAACNSTTEGEGSETHFVCEVDADCAAHAGTVCVEGECVAPPNGAGGAGGEGGAPRTTDFFVDSISHRSVDKIDLLFMIDNSTSMADKQAVLRDAVPDLVRRLVSPQCVDPVTGLRRGNTPDDPAASCTDPDAIREFDAIRDVHVGVITSSLGGHGSTACAPRAGATPERLEMEDDRAELIGSRPRFASVRSPEGQVPSPEGFLDWNPVAISGQSVEPFYIAFQDMTAAAGEHGCEHEAQLESIYRFLVDPAPPTAITLQSCGGGVIGDCATSAGVNQAVLDQRAAFLRPDSLVAIVMLTDENDCSIRDAAQYHVVAGPETTMGASAACATDPNDACCYSCLSAPPPGCSADPACEQLNPQNDPPSLRCFDQKRRFGIDFLYPTQRYVNALRNAEICPEAPDLDCTGGATRVPNPLFTNPGGLPRDPSLVFLAGIVGVPWQDIQARTAFDAEGNEHPVPLNELRYIKASDPRMAEVWPVILGGDGAPPRDKLMIESIFPRAGAGPIMPGVVTSGQLQAPSAGPLANPANGHEHANAAGDDLQYACIFRLAASRDCSQFDPPAGEPPGDRPDCDCTDQAVADKNPLCQADDGTYSRIQRYGKAYPGVRELQVLKDFGNNSIVASICARNLTNTNAQDYGYRPAFDAIVDRLKDALFTRCLPRALEVDEQGNVPCSLIEALHTGTCEPSRGRTDADERHRGPARKRLEQQGQCGRAGQPSCDSFTLCELARADETCLQNVAYQGTPGWCYLDPLPPEQGGQSLGDPSLVSQCRSGEKRLLRFVDPEMQTPAPASTMLIVCEGADLE